VTRKQRIEHKLGNALRAFVTARAWCGRTTRFADTQTHGPLLERVQRWQFRYRMAARNAKAAAGQ
jgi:hypothetical protein